MLRVSEQPRVKWLMKFVRRENANSFNVHFDRVLSCLFLGVEGRLFLHNYIFSGSKVLYRNVWGNNFGANIERVIRFIID